jgi:UDP-2,3-diacylglucosamine pyrophosphatase LpxH
MKFTFCSDLHIFAPHEISDVLSVKINEIESENIWLLGDIIDLKGCDPKDKSLCLGMLKSLNNMYKERYIKGNHDGDTIDPFFTRVGNILMTHGDIICWDNSRAIDFRVGENFQGYGWIKRFINWARHLWKQRISKLEIEQATKYCKALDCNIIVYGHSHTKKLLVKKVNGITIYNIPRGRTELDL